MTCPTLTRVVAPAMILTGACLWAGCSARSESVAPVAPLAGVSAPWDQGWPTALSS
jgi:hypothetical protein